MPRYKSKVVEIEAIQLPEDGNPSDEFIDQLHGFLGDADWEGEDDGINIETLVGTMHASPGDYIIKGLKGEFYPCKPDIFAMKYEEII